MKKWHIFSTFIFIVLIGIIIWLMSLKPVEKKEEISKVLDLGTLSYGEKIKVYTQDDFETFLKAYTEHTLPEIYITEFLFDGVGMYKTYDLDDFVESGNEVEVKPLKVSVININRTGDIEITGEIKGGMIAVNTNELKGNINLILNNVKLDTDSKKVPAIFVYNKDITDTDVKVRLVPKEGTKNYIEGGKFKKVSLVPKESLNDYSNHYSGDALTWYNTYSNYYGIYSASEIEEILFAKVQADTEGLQEGDPYVYYKGAGAISSDIDLTFEGKGYLEVTSKNDEGIETKGDLSFNGGIGDYVIYSLDDGLNTTTSSSVGNNVHNALTIDVNSLAAIVNLEGDEGDAIDSNGTLVINGGTILALAHPGQDAGLDSEKGTYINGGTVLATGDMYDEIKSDSKQNFLVLSFGNKVVENTNIALLDSLENPIFAYETDRSYTNLIYSSSSLINGTYSLYQDGSVSGTKENGVYKNVTSYQKGTLLGYTNTGAQGGMMPSQQNGERPEMPEAPQGERPELPNGEMPEAPQGERPEMPNGGNMGPGGTINPTNKDFVISTISNLFSGIGEYKGE